MRARSWCGSTRTLRSGNGNVVHSVGLRRSGVLQYVYALVHQWRYVIRFQVIYSDIRMLYLVDTVVAHVF
jgi:hypothetical protein